MLYLHGKGIVSAAHRDGVLQNSLPQPAVVFSTHEPDYAQLMNANQLRRTGKHVKMGIAAARMAMKQAGIEKPDALMAGTGLGCLEDTEKFLNSLIDLNETTLSPTSFIQSTHNTVAAQIALLLGCTGYNMTYSHRNFSFEWALLDALLKSNEDEAGSMYLVGATDEYSPAATQIMSQMGLLHPAGGELAAFFVMSAEKKQSRSVVQWTHTDYHRTTPPEQLLIDCLQKHRTSFCDGDVVLAEGLTVSPPFTYGYKHLCGENFSAAAFALWLADEMIASQKVPDVVSREADTPKSIDRVFVCNCFAGRHLSVTLVTKC